MLDYQRVKTIHIRNLNMNTATTLHRGFCGLGDVFFCLGEVPKRDQLLAISSATFRQSNVAEKSFTDFPSWKPPWLVWGFPMNFP